MTNEEAIKILEKHHMWTGEPQEVVDVRIENKALEMAIKALEKDILKEPTQTHKRYGHGNEYNDYYCPECDEFLAYEPQGNIYKYEGGCWSRCRNCGQKIVWRDKSK